MGAVKFDDKTGSIEITYGGRECPFMGIDSTAPDPYIGPGQLTPETVNGFVNNGTLNSFLLKSIFDQSVSATEIIMGVGDLSSQVFLVTYDTSTGNILVYNLPNFPASNAPVLFATIETGYALTLAWSPQPWTITYKNINGICYFSFAGSPFILQHNNVNGSLLTNYLGCAYLSELNGRLIAANVFQIASSNTTNYEPTDPTTGTSATATNNGTSSNTSSPIDTFPNQAVTGSQTVQLQIDLNGVYNCNPQGNPVNIGTLTFNVSIDSGVTWTNFQAVDFSTYNETLPTTLITLPLSGVTNLNTIQLQVIASVTAGNGMTTVSTLTGEITVIAAVIENVTDITVADFPYQYAWSAPEGAYSQFNPLILDPTTGVEVATGAGYNNLPDVEDYITGMFNTGPTQFVLRGQGITEVTPSNNGIEPFTFDHLWASHKGIGTVYPNTIGQYGGMGAFLSDTDIFTFGYEGINSIGGKALSAIYQDLVETCKANLLCGALAPVYFGGETFVAYILCAFLPGNPWTGYVWFLNTKTKEWYKFTFTPTSQPLGAGFINTETGIINTNTIYSVNSIYLGMSLNNAYDLNIIPFPTQVSIANGNLILPMEEIAIGRDITIDSIIVYFRSFQSLSGSLSVIPSISGVNFQTLNDSLINPLTTNQTVVTFDSHWQYVGMVPIDLPYTGKSPQLTLTFGTTENNFTDYLQFGKIVLQGSIDTSQRPL